MDLSVAVAMLRHFQAAHFRMVGYCLQQQQRRGSLA